MSYSSLAKNVIITDPTKKYTMNINDCLKYLNKDLTYSKNGKRYYKTKSQFYIDEIKLKQLCKMDKIDYKTDGKHYYYNEKDIIKLKMKINSIRKNINNKNKKIDNANKNMFKQQIILTISSCILITLIFAILYFVYPLCRFYICGYFAVCFSLSIIIFDVIFQPKDHVRLSKDIIYLL